MLLNVLLKNFVFLLILEKSYSELNIDPHVVLKVGKDASMDEVRSAFRKLSKYWYFLNIINFSKSSKFYRFF
jgi:preprotein translocase subunit Sec63